MFLLSSLAVLLALFVRARYRPRARLRILLAAFALLVTTWSFVALSLAFCESLVGLYEAGEEVTAVTRVLGLALVSSIFVAILTCLIVTLKLPPLMSRRLTERLPKQDWRVVEMTREMADRLKMTTPTVLRHPSGAAFAYSVGGERSIMVVSKGMTDRLEMDELEAVLVHELGHIKSHYSELSTTIAVYRRILFFDPFVRLFERVLSREKEFYADEVSARETGKPLSLASALLKLSSVGPRGPGPSTGAGGLSILGPIGVSRPPDVRERIERLMWLHDQFGSPPPVGP